MYLFVYTHRLIYVSVYARRDNVMSISTEKRFLSPLSKIVIFSTSEVEYSTFELNSVQSVVKIIVSWHIDKISLSNSFPTYVC